MKKILDLYKIFFVLNQNFTTKQNSSKFCLISDFCPKSLGFTGYVFKFFLVPVFLVINFKNPGFFLYIANPVISI